MCCCALYRNLEWSIADPEMKVKMLTLPVFVILKIILASAQFTQSLSLSPSLWMLVVTVLLLGCVCYWHYCVQKCDPAKYSGLVHEQQQQQQQQQQQTHQILIIPKLKRKSTFPLLKRKSRDCCNPTTYRPFISNPLLFIQSRRMPRVYAL